MRYTHDRRLMGKWADGPVRHACFMLIAVLIVALNALLIVLVLRGEA